MSYLHFLSVDLRLCQAVRFGHNRNDVDFVMQRLHTRNIQRPETDVTNKVLCDFTPAGDLQKDVSKKRVVSAPVAERRDEVEAAVDSVVLDVPSVQAALISEVLLKLLVDVVFYRLPADADVKYL